MSGQEPNQAQPQENMLWLDEMDLASMSSGWGVATARQTVLDRPLTVQGQVYARGVGTHSPSEYILDMDGCALAFEALVGVDDETHQQGCVGFQVLADGQVVAQSRMMNGGEPPEKIYADLNGAGRVTLLVIAVNDNNHQGHADWLEARFHLVPGTAKRPVPLPLPEPAMPKMGRVATREPRINGPRVVGATPGRPFLFRVPAYGEGTLTFGAEGLPAGVTLDEQTGIISGVLRQAGDTDVRLTVGNAAGQAIRQLKIVAGEGKLSRTPPMGWNSWNVWGLAVDDAKVRAAADAFVATGLAAHGYQYINIDDGWEGTRDSRGRLQTNDRFPDMKELCAYVHSKGLKIGIYSSPGPKTCGGFEGSLGHEEEDARMWAEWGIDYLKHDWCSYRATDKTRAAFRHPYEVMRAALDKSGRDIVYSLCQYGMSDVWTWGDQIGANLWRTTGDITDTWGSMASIGFSQHHLHPFAGPGHWNDPDMLVVGKVGWGPKLHQTKLTPMEQLTHISLWSLLAAPLLIGCDLTALDDFTLAILTNDEVLDVNQDPLGRQAQRVRLEGPLEVWARPLADGSMAVGLFNRGRETARVTAPWADLSISGPQTVRDLWLHENLGTFEKEFSVEVPAHGVAMVKMIPL